MEITIDKEILLSNIQIVQKSVTFKNTMPILSSILLVSKKNNIITMSATDSETSIECQDIQATVKKEGKIAIPAKYILEIVRRLPNGDINIKTKNNTIIIEYLKNKLSLNGYDADEFPEFKLTKESKISFKVPVTILKKALSQVLFAVGKDETKPVFTGVLFEFKKNSNGSVLTLVATDTHRLALKEYFIDDIDIKSDINVIIPGDTLEKLMRILAVMDVDGAIDITIKENQIIFDITNTKFISRLIKGNFPAYEHVIPKDHKSKIKIDRSEFLSSIERSQLLMKKDNKTINLSTDEQFLSEQKEDLLFLTANTEVGSIHEEINIVREGEPIQIAFNASYITEILNTINAEKINIEVSGPLSPGIIKPITDNGDLGKYIVLILPVRSV